MIVELLSLDYQYIFTSSTLQSQANTIKSTFNSIINKL